MSVFSAAGALPAMIRIPCVKINISIAVICRAVVRISNIKNASAHINSGFKPSCGSIAFAANGIHPMIVMFAVGRCQTMSRAIAWSIPDFQPSPRTFCGDLSVEMRRVLKALATRISADMFISLSLSFSLYAVIIAQSVLRRPLSRRDEQFERTWVWYVIATCFGSLFLGTCSIIRFASPWDSRRYRVDRFSVHALLELRLFGQIADHSPHPKKPGEEGWKEC